MALLLPTSGPEFDQSLVRGGELLTNNGNPGRVLNMGLSADGRFLYEGYILGGRSEPSRERILRQEGNVIRAVAPGLTEEEMLASGGSLRYYPALQAESGLYVVSNGAQTSHVVEAMLEGATLEEAVKAAPVVEGIIDNEEVEIDLSSYEPDSLNTPRITGVIDTREQAVTQFGLAVVKKSYESDRPVYTFYETDLSDLTPGNGWGIQTYDVNDPDAEPGDPRGEVHPFAYHPYRLEFGGSPEEFAAHLRQQMGERTFAAAAVQVIDVQTGQAVNPAILNRLAA